MLYIVFSHKWKILLCFVIATAAAVWYVSHAPTGYVAEARVLVRADRAGLAVDPSGTGALLESGRIGVNLRGELGIIQSRGLAERVIDALGIEQVFGLPPQAETVASAPTESLPSRLPPPSAFVRVLGFLNLLPEPVSLRERAIQAVMGRLSVGETTQTSGVLSMTYTSGRPELAQRVLDAIVNQYVQLHFELNKAQLSPEFLSAKVVELKEKLAQKDNALQQLTKDPTGGSIVGQQDALPKQLSNLEAQRDDGLAQVRAAKARIEFLENLMAAHPLDGATNSQIAGRIAELQLQEIQLRSGPAPDPRKLQEVRTEIKSLQRMQAAKGGVSQGAESPVDSIQQDLFLRVVAAKEDMEAQTARLQELEPKIASLRESVASLASHKDEIAALNQERATIESEYSQYLNSLRTAEIAAALDRDKIGNVSVIQKATALPGSTREPHKLLAILVFLPFFGLCGGFTLAFVLEYLNHTLRTTNQVERQLGLPVLASLPYSRKARLLVHKESA
ncbi:MAG: hypothetical protein NTW86_31145 [Candidatus Sumerlaeota bacterium]|nr:hypothetical protein [Candidatus Sumerlaeota bacterium]